MGKDVVRPSTGTIVSGMAERKEAGVLGTAGPSNDVSQACQENFYGSDSPMPTALPPTKTPCRLQTSDDSNAPFSTATSSRPGLMHPQ